MRTTLRRLARALRLRCPLCGSAWPRRGWLGFAPHCPACQLQLERNENDAFLGSYTLNLFATLLVATLVTVLNVWWVELAAGWRLAASLVGIMAFALAFHPLSKTLWLVLDLQFRPPVEHDFDDGTGG